MTSDTKFDFIDALVCFPHFKEVPANPWAVLAKLRNIIVIGVPNDCAEKQQAIALIDWALNGHRLEEARKRAPEGAP